MRARSFLPPPGAGGSLFSGAAHAQPGTGGKNSKQEHLGSPYGGGMSTIAGGDPLARAMGHYGKASKGGGMSQVRGGAGGMTRNPRKGGLGPGPMASPGGPGDYSMTNPDLE